MKIKISAALFLLLCAHLTAECQKLITHDVYEQWPSVSSPNITSDGKYMSYSIEKGGNATITVIRSTTSNWSMQVPGGEQITNTADGRYMALTIPGDSLMLVKLGKSVEIKKPHVNSFKFGSNQKSNWLGCLTDDQLIVTDIEKRKEKHLKNVVEFFFVKNSNYLLVKEANSKNQNSPQRLRVINLLTDEDIEIGQNQKIDNIIIDRTSARVAYAVVDTIKGEPVSSIWYFEFTQLKPVMIVSDLAPEIPKGLKIALEWRLQLSFSYKGDKLFFNLFQPNVTDTTTKGAPVDVWTYRDSQLQENQLANRNVPRCFFSVVGINEKRLIRLEMENEKFVNSFPIAASAGGFFFRRNNSMEEYPNDVGMLMHFKDDVSMTEWNWNPACQMDFYLISTVDGSRKHIPELDDKNEHKNYFLSPSGAYIIYYDPKKAGYFSYDVKAARTIEVVGSREGKWVGFTSTGTYPDAPYWALGPLGWLKDSTSFLLCDENDVWLVKADGGKPAVNITNYFGRNNNIEFRPLPTIATNTLTNRDELLLSSFNFKTKANGFYKVKLAGGKIPQLLTSGPFLFYLSSPPADVSNGMPPIRAENANAFIVQRMSATEAPNLFYTTDLRNFKQLTNCQPQKNYNWLTTELHSFLLPNGDSLEGVLYKPQNFDPRKKYSVIIHYYRILSTGLNEYLQPRACDGRLKVNLPYYVSNGYLIFTPDIKYKMGETGESALACVTAAGKYLAGLPYVDGTKMGIQGHSFGGFETNYIVTHSSLFAAACSSAGVTDFISSAYGTIYVDGEGLLSKQWQFELGPYQMGASLWEKPELYIKNSPIFSAGHVTTPLLLMTSKNDNTVSFSQAVEFFTGLRRLRKKVWMLQYDDGMHTIHGESAKDFSIRLSQFYDHFLKGAKAPVWMTKGIPATEKGTYQGYESDASSETPR